MKVAPPIVWNFANFARSSGTCKRAPRLGTALTGAAAFLALLMPQAAHAQNECGPPTNGVVTCTAAGNPYPNGITYSAPGDLAVVTRPDVVATGPVGLFGGAGSGRLEVQQNGSVSTTGSFQAGVLVSGGTVETRNPQVIVSGTGRVSTSGDASIGVSGASPGAVSLSQAQVFTSGRDSVGVRGFSNGGGPVTINVGSVTTTGNNSVGIVGESGFGFNARGDVTVDFGTVSTGGFNANGISAVSVSGNALVSGRDVTTRGTRSGGIVAFSSTGDARVTTTGTISTSGSFSAGVEVGSAPLSANPSTTVAVTNNGRISTSGQESPGIRAFGPNVVISGAGSVSTSGASSPAIRASSSAGSLSISQSSVSTTGNLSRGVEANASGGPITINLGQVTTAGSQSLGILATGASTNANVRFDRVTTGGFGAAGVLVTSFGDISITGRDVTTRGFSSVGIAAQSGFFDCGNANCGGNGGNITIETSGTVSTTGIGISASNRTGTITIRAANVQVATNSTAIEASSGNSVDITVSGMASTGPAPSPQVPGRAAVVARANTGSATVTVANVSTVSDFADGVSASTILGGVDVTVTGNITTRGGSAEGVDALALAGPATLTNSGTIATSGGSAGGVLVRGSRGATVNGAGSVSTSGDRSTAIVASSSGGGAVSVTQGAVSTSGAEATAVSATSFGAPAGTVAGPVTVNVGSVRASGARSNGVFALGDGAVAVTTGTASSIDSTALVLTSRASSATVTVTGLTTSGTSDAVSLAAATTATANVGAGATVSGGLNSILLQSGTGSTVNNEGTINSSTSGFAIQANGAATIVNNRGRINGRIDLTDANDAVNNSGVFAAAGASLFGAGTDVFNNSGIVLVPGSVTFTTLEAFNNSGLVDLRDGTVGSRFNLGGAAFGGSGGSRLAIDVNFAAGTSDLITLGRAEGSTAVIVTPVGGVAVLTPGIRFAQAGAGSSATAFTTGNQSEFGLVRLDVSFNAADNSFSLVGSPSGAAFRATTFAEATRSLWHKSAEAWTAQMRGSRDLAPDAVGEGRTRFWLQPYAAAHSRGGTGSFRLMGQDRTVSLAYDQDYFGGQLGLDFGGGGPAGGLRFGLTGGYLDSHVDFDPATDRLRMKAVNAGAYASFASGPFFADLLAKYDRVDIDARSAGAAFELDGDSYGGMLEIGFRGGSVDGFFFEPTASIAYVNSDLDGLELFGTRLSFDVDESLRGKLGARLGTGFALPGGSRGLVYLGGNYVHEFRAEDRIRLASAATALDFDAREAEEFGEGFVGLSIAATGPVSGFIEGFGRKGQDFEGGGARAGLRIRF